MEHFLALVFSSLGALIVWNPFRCRRCGCLIHPRWKIPGRTIKYCAAWKSVKNK